MSQSNGSILQVLKLYHTFLKIFGLVQFSLNEIESCRTPRSSILINLIQIIFSLSTISQFIKYSMLLSNRILIAQLIFLVNGISILLIVLGNFVWGKMYKEKIFLLFQKLFSISKDFEKCDMTMNYRNIWRCALVFLVMETAIVIGHVTMHFVVNWRNDDGFLKILFTAISFLAVNGSSMNLSCLFVTMFSTLRYMFVELNRGLGDHDVSVKKIRQYCILYENLCGVIRLGCEIFSGLILLLFGSSFIITTLQIYANIVSDYNDPTRNFMFSSYEIAILFYKMALQIIISQQLERSANSVKITMFKLLIKKPSYFYQKEVNAFSLQLLHNNAKVNAGKLFDINYSFGMNIVCSILTYLIILIQTDPLGSSTVKQAIFESKI